MISVGIIEGSSVMGLAEDEYEALSVEGKAAHIERVRRVYENCGADYVINNMSELCALIDKIEQSYFAHAKK